jgi:thymidylate synthase (FAD)
MFEPIELREQCEDNRQSSTQVFNPDIQTSITMSKLKTPADQVIMSLLNKIKDTYNKLLDAGVAREQARMILPMTTKTKIYMTGSVRSWIHFFDLRDDSHAQKEIQDVAKAGKIIFKEQFPIISKALNF